MPAAVASIPSGPSPPQPTHTTGTGRPQLATSQEAARAVIKNYVLTSAWFEADERGEGPTAPLNTARRLWVGLRASAKRM